MTYCKKCDVYFGSDFETCALCAADTQPEPPREETLRSSDGVGACERRVEDACRRLTAAAKARRLAEDNYKLAQEYLRDCTREYETAKAPTDQALRPTGGRE